MFSEYLKMRESLHTGGWMQWLTTLILGWFYLGTKVLSWDIDLNGIENKNIFKYPYPTDIKKYEILIIDTQMVSIDYTIPALVITDQKEVM